MTISLVMLFHKTKFVISVYRVPCRVWIWRHVAEYCINFYHDPVVTSLGAARREPARQPLQLQPGRMLWKAWQETGGVRELETAWAIYTHDQVYKEICHLSGPKLV